MNVAESIHHLKNIGWVVHEVEPGKYSINRIGHKQYCPSNLYPEMYAHYIQEGLYSERELVKFAEIYSSNNKQNTTMKKNVKHFAKRKLRAKERDLINSGNVEKIDELSTYRPLKTEDPWNWD